MKFFTVPFLLLILASCNSVRENARVTGLRCEYLQNPLGLDRPQPRLFWKMNSTARGAMQTAYEIQAASAEALLQQNKADLWNTGKVASEQSIQIPYNGKALHSGQKVFWRVRVWDEAGKPSNWSETAHWEMALMNASDWQAKWIGGPPALFSGDQKYAAPYFRKEWKVSGDIKSARAYISGLGYYELYINGKKSGDHVLSPNQTNYDKRYKEPFEEKRAGNMTTTVLYETHDITPMLTKGDNAIGIILGHGWYYQTDPPENETFLYDSPRVAGQFVIEYEDGRKETLSTDENWLSAAGAIRSNGLHTGEIYDARLDMDGWNTAGFNAAGWAKAVLVKPPSGILKAQASPPDRVTETIRPVKVTQPDKGIFRFDMGRMISGWARLNISGAKGTQIKMIFTEELGPTYGQTDTYILKGSGSETWEPRFTWHAFRYVDVIGSPVELTASNLEGRVVNTDVDSAGTFECSNPLLNQILTNYRYTQLGNMHGGVPSDCPHRERRGYTGDGQISANAAIYNFDMAPFYTKWIGDISDGQNHVTGYVPNTTPYDGGGGGTPWGSAYVIIPWLMYQYYGDTAILQQHYEGMKHWISFMKNSLDAKGLLSNQGLGEWVPPAFVEIDPDYVNSCYYLLCNNLMQDISGVLRKTADRAYFASLATKAAADIHKAYFRKDSAIFASGTQGANAYPLGFGFANKADEKAIFDKLVQTILKNNVHFDTGIIGTPLLLQVLTEMGRVDLAYTLMNQRDFPSFGYMIEKGATTIWETFQGDVSHSHPMFGSVCEWMYKYLGGIRPHPASPGFKHTIIKPYPVSSLSFVRSSYPSLYGLIESHWKLSAEQFELDISIPANTTASAYIFAANPQKITEGGQPLANNKYVKFVRMDGDFAVFDVSSGRYHFSSPGVMPMLKKTILTAPVIKPALTYAFTGETVPVTMSTDVQGATIYFTTDGTEPTSQSMVYKDPIPVNQPTSFRARVMKEGYENSFFQNAYIGFIDSSVNGIQYDYYEGKWVKLPDFSTLPVIRSGKVYALRLDSIVPSHDLFALVFRGWIKIEKEGAYNFFIQSNDGTRLFIDEKLVVDHDGPHGADIEKSGSTRLSAGWHPLTLHYFQAGGGLFLKVQYQGPGVEKQELPPSLLFKKPLAQ